MTKKKSKKTIKDYILTPVSLKRAIMFCLLFAALSGLNMYFFVTTPAKEIANQTVVSQAELMNVLGSTVQLGNEDKQTYAPFYNKPEVSYWYTILQDKPEFRDAHIILATLAYNDHNCQIAASHISTAMTLDPTDKRITQLQEIINQCQK